VLNVGASGTVMVDERSSRWPTGLPVHRRGSKEIGFASDDPKQPARFYLLSYPAHAEYPTVHLKRAQAEPVHLGTPEQANKRTIYKYIHRPGPRAASW